MRKKYPYLREQYILNLNKEQEKRTFLSQLDNLVNQRQYILITLLDWKENPIKEIQGELTGGTLSKDGSSSVRQTGTISCSVSNGEYNIENLDSDFSLNKKIFIEIGIKNETDYYKDYPILWFPQGVFLISDFSMNSATSSAVNLNISLKDKMALLNGDIGGKLPATVQFDIMDTQLPNGEWVQQKVLLYNIILELVNHYGEVDINNIIIEDVPLRIKQIMKWTGKNDLYQYSEGKVETEASANIFTVQKLYDENNRIIEPDKIFKTDMDVGYVYKDFVYNSDLVGNAGTAITTILDTIKDYLGNYEYFFDEYGIFRFQEIRNFLNITQAQVIEESMNNPSRRVSFEGGNFLLDQNSEKQYLIETTNSKTVYSFTDDRNITSITVTPQYTNIKNDYIIEGLKQGSSSDIKYSVRYHLAIDNKPEIIGYYNGRAYYGIHNNVIYYTDESVAEINLINKLGIVYYPDNNILPIVGNFNLFYCVDNTCYYWDGSTYKELFLITYDETNTRIENKVIPMTYYSYDWRTELYLQGLEANINGTDTNYYFEELDAFWPQEYDLNPAIQRFFGEEEDKSIQFYSLTTGNFFLDFIEASSSSLGEYSVQAIGRRQEVKNDDKVNCLFIPEIPNVIFLNKDNPDINWTENTTGIQTEEELNKRYANTFKISVDAASKIISEVKKLNLQRKECELNTQPWTQVDNNIFSNLTIGGHTNSAYEAIRYELFCHTRYQKTVSITTLPVYFLAPNSRVKLNSESVNVYGDFMVQNLNITFGPGANMSVVLNEVAERL